MAWLRKSSVAKELEKDETNSLKSIASVQSRNKQTKISRKPSELLTSVPEKSHKACLASVCASIGLFVTIIALLVAWVTCVWLLANVLIRRSQQTSGTIAATLTWIFQAPENTTAQPQENSILAGSHEFFSSLRGPLITTNFPDPCIIQHAGLTYAFATNNKQAGPEHVNIQVAITENIETWTLHPETDALPQIASWQTGKAVWAPDIKHITDGRFLLYYTDQLASDPATHCVGAAIANNVTGPYKPLEHPLICPKGGAIDPAGFFDRSTGRRYLIYKVDGNSLGHGGSCNNDVLPLQSTPLMLQEVDAIDGTALIGEPVSILDRDVQDGPLVEAPALHLTSDGIYFLFYSSNCFTTPLYHTNYATATKVTGPYTRASRPLLSTGDAPGLVGPGGMDIMHHNYEDTADFGATIVKKQKHRLVEESRMIVFHGVMTVHDIPGMRSSSKTPAKDLHLPFTRGLYSARAHFRGRTVTLRQEGFPDSVLDDSELRASKNITGKCTKGVTDKETSQVMQKMVNGKRDSVEQAHQASVECTVDTLSPTASGSVQQHIGQGWKYAMMLLWLTLLF